MKRPGRPRTKNPVAESMDLRRRAGEHLLRAQAALLDSHKNGNLACAIVWIALAMLRIAQSDPDERARDVALGIIDQMRSQHPPRQPGPYSGT